MQTDNKIVRKLVKAQETEEQQLRSNPLLEEMLNREANVLLLGAGSDDERVLQTLGLDHVRQYQKELTEDIRRTKKAKDIYNTHVFTGKQMMMLCNTYYMKILHTSHYNGNLTAELPRKLKEFCDKNSIDMAVESNNFFILAPIEDFKTTANQVIIIPKPVRMTRNDGPILVYRAPQKDTSSANSFQRINEGDTLVQVYNWGSDFSEFRKLRYIFNNTIEKSDEGSNRFHASIGIFIFILTLILAIFVKSIIVTPIGVAILAVLCIIIPNLTNQADKLWNKSEI